MSNKRKVYLAVINYPYCGGEINFIDPELKYLRKYFDVTIISNISKQNYKKHMEVEKAYSEVKFIRYHEKIGISDYLWFGFLAFFDSYFWSEVRDILLSGEKFFLRIKDSISFYIHARKYGTFLKRFLLKESAVYYSYWYTSLCYGAVMCKRRNRELKVISRSHNVDLYDERTLGKRQPFMQQMDEEIDKILFIAQYGMDYYLNRYGRSATDSKYCLCRLGMEKDFGSSIFKNRQEYVVVSCSYVVPIKRVDKIINAIALIDDIDIQWIHFGGGELYDELHALAKRRLSEKHNISFSMPGQIDNEEIKKFYRENRVDCFITTSALEGCPVSIQEALLYGVPIIGTDVGGISEMIQGNGILLDKNPTEEQIKDAIIKMYNASAEEVKEMRKHSREIWEKNFNIARNAIELVKIIEEI